MQFLEWLDKHFASNCHYYYADDLMCPFDLFAEPKPDTPPHAEPAQPQAAGPDASTWQ